MKYYDINVSWFGPKKSIVIVPSRHASRTFQRNFLGVEGELLKKTFLCKKLSIELKKVSKNLSGCAMHFFS